MKAAPIKAGGFHAPLPHSSDERGSGASTQTKTDESPRRAGMAVCRAPGDQVAKAQLRSQPVPSAVNNGIQQARSEGADTSKSSPSKEAWYLLASMWGAVFTYIVAPLVVHFLTNRKDAREHSSAGARA
jgi:hypothetical protein